MPRIHVFTSAALNYLPKVRMLFRSLRAHHPDWKLHLVLADEIPPGLDFSAEPLDSVVPLRELSIPHWQGWSFGHRLVELATAIKPFMLARLLAREDCDRVFYFDPDMVAFSPLDDLIAALDDSHILLTPHQASPETTLGAVMDNEIGSLKHGIYNLGFIGVADTDTGRAFADWWSQRLYHFCRDDIPNGLFTDQRWIDLVPAFFPGVAIMRSPRHNVATWNLSTRTLEKDEAGQYCVDGEPLGFYHFTGFDSGSHRLMAEKNRQCTPATRDLIDWYTRETDTLAADPLASSPWAYGWYTDGTAITIEQRHCYRDHPDLQRRFPDPYEASGYLDWWQRQGQARYRPQSVLTPGFMGDDENTGARLGQAAILLRRAIARPGTGVAMARRGWEVLRSEGWQGIKRRLNR